MLQFHPPGTQQQIFKTSLGVMASYMPSYAFGRSNAQIHQSLPPLVFLHSLGGGSSAYEWSKVYPAFAADYRIIAPDLIGWGQSSHPTRDYQIADYLTLLTELFEQVDAPAIVAASSLTAGLTVQLAVQRPELFQYLFLISPAGYGEAGADYGRGLAAQLAGTPGIDRLLYLIGAANELAVRGFLENFLFGDRSRVTPEMVSAYLASAQQFNAEYAALASLKGNLCFDLRDYMGQLRTPTTIVWGERSRFGTPSLGQTLASLNPQFVQSFQLIPQAGVLPHLELPAVVIGLLYDALSGLRSLVKIT
jgi:pimeloyl-ACP methyl ester carboxylesterase